MSSKSATMFLFARKTNTSFFINDHTRSGGHRSRVIHDNTSENAEKHQRDRSTKTTWKRVQHGKTLVQTIKHDSNRAHRHMGTLNGTDMPHYAALTTETPPSALCSAHMSSYLKPTRSCRFMFIVYW